MKCGSNKFCVGFESDHKVYCYGDNAGCLWGQNSCNTDQDCFNKFTTSSAKYTDGDKPDCSSGNLGWRQDACPDPYTTTKCNPYTILCSGTDGTLWSRDGLDATWVKIQDDSNVQNIVAICTSNDGKTIIGCNKQQNVVKKTSWDAPNWIGGIESPCCVQSVAVGKDGTLVGVGMDNQLYSKTNLNSNWIKTANSNEWITSIAIAPDGSIFCIGGGNQIWKKNSYLNLEGQNWQSMGGCCVKAITIAPDGTFIGVGMDNQLYSKTSYTDLTTPWKGPYTSSCCAVSITTVSNRNKTITASQPVYSVNNASNASVGTEVELYAAEAKFEESKAEYVALMNTLQTSCLGKNVSSQCQKAAELNASMQTSLIQMSNLLKKGPQSLPRQKELLDLANQLERDKDQLLTTLAERDDLDVVASMNYNNWLTWFISAITVSLLILYTSRK